MKLQCGGLPGILRFIPLHTGFTTGSCERLHTCTYVQKYLSGMDYLIFHNCEKGEKSYKKGISSYQMKRWRCMEITVPELTICTSIINAR